MGLLATWRSVSCVLFSRSLTWHSLARSLSLVSRSFPLWLSVIACSWWLLARPLVLGLIRNVQMRSVLVRFLSKFSVLIISSFISFWVGQCSSLVCLCGSSECNIFESWSYRFASNSRHNVICVYWSPNIICSFFLSARAVSKVRSFLLLRVMILLHDGSGALTPLILVHCSPWRVLIL